MQTQIDKDFVRWCEDIGQFAIDRRMFDVVDEHNKLLASGSCSFATSWCLEECYNFKLHKMFPNMEKKDIRNEKNWQKITGKDIFTLLSRKRKSIKRFRGCTRGENIKDLKDIDRWEDIAIENPDTEIWIPTKAWRDPFLKQEIEERLFPFTNLAINASVDPTTTEKQWIDLIEAGWSTMFVGDDERKTNPLGEPLFKCPKTGVFKLKASDSEEEAAWKKKNKGHCGICKAGCFGNVTLKRRTDTLLYEH